MKITRTMERWSPLVVLAAFLLLWQLTVMAFDIAEFIFPSPWQIAKDFVEYRLLDEAGVVVISYRKTGFCWTNSAKLRGTMVSQVFPNFGDCVMVSGGWYDLYHSGLGGQEVNLTGVPDGVYRLEYVFDEAAKLNRFR